MRAVSSWHLLFSWCECMRELRGRFVSGAVWKQLVRELSGRLLRHDDGRVSFLHFSMCCRSI